MRKYLEALTIAKGRYTIKNTKVYRGRITPNAPKYQNQILQHKKVGKPANEYSGRTRFQKDGYDKDTDFRGKKDKALIIKW